MTQTAESVTTGANRTSNLLIGVGTVLLGTAALIIALQWRTHTTISVESPQDASAEKAGFTLVSEKEETALGTTKYHHYLLDRDSGRIWARADYRDSWSEVYVEGVTPSDSPASSRN